MEVGLSGVENADSRQNFREQYYGFYRVLGTKGEKLHVQAMMVMLGLNQLDILRGRKDKGNATLCIVASKARGSDITDLLHMYDNDAEKLRAGLISGNAAVRMPDLHLRIDLSASELLCRH